MPRTPFDAYSKDFLDEFLSPTGRVTSGKEIQDEARQIDVWYIPDPKLSDRRQELGLLGRMAAQPCMFEPYSGRPRLNEVRSCILKLMVMLLDRVRTAKREEQPVPSEEELPMLWILSPFASPTLMENFGASPQLSSWPEGVFFAANAFRTGFVAIALLPETEDTLLLRLLGRGRTLERAIAELLQLPPQEKRDRALQLLANWKVRIEEIQEPDAENRELIMALSPALIELKQQARQEGIEQRSRLTLETLLLSRFGQLDSQLEGIVEYFARLSSEDYARQLPLLLSLSRDELAARFSLREGNGNGTQE